MLKRAGVYLHLSEVPWPRWISYYWSASVKSIWIPNKLTKLQIGFLIKKKKRHQTSSLYCTFEKLIIFHELYLLWEWTGNGSFYLSLGCNKTHPDNSNVDNCIHSSEVICKSLYSTISKPAVFEMGLLKLCPLQPVPDTQLEEMRFK